jgi:hypothetical protein
MGIPVLSSVPEFVAWEETRGEKYEFADGEVSPDERDRPEQKVLRYPILVVEILSASTERVDPGAKLDEYRSIEALAEYALVDSRKRRAQMFGASRSYGLRACRSLRAASKCVASALRSRSTRSTRNGALAPRRSRPKVRRRVPSLRVVS